MNAKSHIFVLAFLAILFSASISYAQHGHDQTVASIPCDSTLPANLLNSERIEKKFGAYGIDVLYNSPHLRVSNLYDGKKITRTLAIVDYPENIDSSFSKEHEQVVNGGSIGSTFKAQGWKIEKKTIYLGELSPSVDYNALYKLMGNVTPQKLSIWMYIFYIQKNGKEYPYVTISEIYHPDYLSLADLRCISNDADVHLKQTKAVTHKLKKVTQLMTLKFNQQTNNK
ncbi:hypothetical protein [Chitinophaga pinensis]|uniref:Secreted protein n=1 Tax=Chitinophaga pinensis (strain ATCC 43595 / DSM 2588 / LMG 13176 / NBRC 15968 / NCIMB 11800 / UQM 2034) TaxID=485918 RepID=A0A979GZL2_CHIPD|nr:hypothetical protein [Chitinophaga pinensis]ACU64084.1 hypothetical protein Cpin_6681 [Chitinophaga pinensis DSM 2588]